MPTNTYTVTATSPWQTLFDLGNRQTATMTASGSWTWDKNSGRNCGPGGNRLSASGGSPEPGAEGCLVWRIYREVWEGGQDIKSIPYHTYFSFDNQSYNLNAAGQYQFQINDNDLSDNSG